jgi:hypothetical protein
MNVLIVKRGLFNGDEWNSKHILIFAPFWSVAAYVLYYFHVGEALPNNLAPASTIFVVLLRDK